MYRFSRIEIFRFQFDRYRLSGINWLVDTDKCLLEACVRMNKYKRFFTCPTHLITALSAWYFCLQLVDFSPYRITYRIKKAGIHCQLPLPPHPHTRRVPATHPVHLFSGGLSLNQADLKMALQHVYTELNIGLCFEVILFFIVLKRLQPSKLEPCGPSFKLKRLRSRVLKVSQRVIWEVFITVVVYYFNHNISRERYMSPLSAKK